MITVRMTEMYDMSTTKGKIGLIGIHTPTASAMAKRWKGLFDNHRFYKILGVDVKIACASILPADPLQVGVENGDIAPQDMMNPLLYTTMTNEGWNALINRIYTNATTVPGYIENGSVKGIPNGFASLSDTEQEYLYYQMLSSDRFRKAMPQNGLSMTNVKPFVHQVVSTFGQQGNSSIAGQQGTGPGVVTSASDGASYNQNTAVANVDGNMFIRGKAVPYPRLPCSIPGSQGADPNGDHASIPNGVPILEVNPPFKTFCCAVILPPAKLHEMYFRMLISWKIAFIKPATMLEKVQAGQLAYDSDIYYRSYSFTQAKDLDREQLEDDDETDSVASVDALNMNPNLVMEK